MINKIRQFITNYRISKKLPCNDIQPKDLIGVLTLEDIGRDLYMESWPGIGCFIGINYREPNNVTYTEAELMSTSYGIIDALSKYTVIAHYKQQQLN
jgi:hypothetical protein